MGKSPSRAGVPCFTLIIYPPDGKPGRSKHGGFCKGAYMLLCGIDDNGSLNKTAKEMGMSYSKAWRMLKDLADDFGHPLIVGTVPQGSEITEFGYSLMEEYEHLMQDASVLRGRHVWR